jgi:FemAB-related protein (PEP-CTERM system-associated)
MGDFRHKSIKLLDTNRESFEIWNRYVKEAPTASFYHQFEWKSVNETEFQHTTFYIASTNAGQIDGILPLVLIRSRLFGRILCSLPFVNFCGPAALTPDVEKDLLKRAYEIADEQKVDYLEIRGLRIHDEQLPNSQNKVSMTVRLSADPDDLWSGFQSKHRTAIRRVYKSGLHVRFGREDMLDTFYDVMCHSWRSLGTPIYRKQYFQSILRAFGDQVLIFVAYKGDLPVAAAFNGYCGNTVEGMWAGALPQFRRLQSNYVLYWEMIKKSCEDGFELYHLGRTSAGSGGEAFKKKWRADSRQLYWQYYLPGGGNMPELNVDNPKYKYAIRVWQKLPLWVTKAAGPLLARNIP